MDRGHQLFISFGASDLQVASGAPHTCCLVRTRLRPGRCPLLRPSMGCLTSKGSYYVPPGTVPCPSFLWCLGNCQLFLCANPFAFVYDGWAGGWRVIDGASGPPAMHAGLLVESGFPRGPGSPCWWRGRNWDGQGWSRRAPTLPTANQAQLLRGALVCSWGFLSPVLFTCLKYIQACVCSFKFQLWTLTSLCYGQTTQVIAHLLKDCQTPPERTLFTKSRTRDV